MRKHLTILIFPIVTFVFFVGCFSYILFMIGLNSEKISDLEKEKVARALAREKTEELEISIKETMSLLSPTEAIWLSEEETPEFFGFIESIGKISGAKVSIVNITDKSASKEGLSMLLSVEGTFENVFGTLKLLENIPYATSFSKIALHRNEESGLWLADIDFIILSFKE
jgi:hypothetical protein